MIGEQLILALDTPDVNLIWPLVAKTSPPLSFFKVGLELFMATGPTVIRQLKASQQRVFLDLKLHDIPNTVAGACRVAAGLGVDLLTVHSSGGRAMLRAAVQAVAGSPTRLVAVTLLTSLGERELQDQLQIPGTVADYVVRQAILAQSCGVQGVVASPWEAELIRKHCGPDFLIVTPGIRTRPSFDDQQRVCTAQQALAWGADYLVLGRTITQQQDPAQALKDLLTAL
ncbi:orotidine-5'-phosphate decarboxylase [Candidatus Cyanaurora vandensis]|uniref:orotidine-5'-phosphate decarboxylase n=1 Tax=Candidatus Cyanaurora vandensis TaxID=2714958 RepID=UPI00257E98A5|nr:orotidine-5'-phosphate decarboxylase [Candidatus Cyanaurora vandensis]